MIASPLKDSLFAEHDALTEATAGSIAGRIAFGPRAGEYVRRICGGFGYGEEVPLAKGKLCYSVNGFTLHARTHSRQSPSRQARRICGKGATVK